MTLGLEWPEAIIFDWDDTLAGNWESIHGALNAALVAMDQEPWTMERARANVRRSLRDSFPEMFGNRWEEAADIFYEHIKVNHLSTLKSQDYANELLNELISADLALGIVSNKTTNLLQAECGHLGWIDHFSSIIGAGDAVKDKPAPDPIFMCLNAMNLAPSKKIWYVGDAPTDIESANQAGVTAALIKDSDVSDDFAHTTVDQHFKNLKEMAVFVGILKQSLSNR